MEGLRGKLVAVVGLPGEAVWRGEIEKIEKSSPKDSWGQYSVGLVGLAKSSVRQ